MNFSRLFFVTALLFLSACSTKTRPPLPPGIQEQKEVPVIYHQVKYPGETLAVIAKWYTGDTRNWKKLAGMNPDVNPDKIYLDQVIKIPRDMAEKTVPYNLIELRRAQRAMQGLPEVAPLYSSREPERNKVEVPFPEPDEPGIQMALPPKASEGKKDDSAARQEAPLEIKKPVRVVSVETDDPEQARRRELQEKTRQELLRDMIEGEAAGTQEF